MRRFFPAAVIITAATLAAGAVLAAELEIPKPRTAKEISMQKGPPHCSRWSDDCVNCARSANGAPPACSNIGFACQPKAVRCLD